MGLDAIGIVCNDIQESIKFYNILGIEFNKIAQEHFEGVTPSGIRLMLDSLKLMKEINPNWNDTPGNNMILCFKQTTPGKVDMIYNRLCEIGAKSVKEPWDAFWGQRYSSVLDPNGNQIDIFCPL